MLCGDITFKQIASVAIKLEHSVFCQQHKYLSMIQSKEKINVFSAGVLCVIFTRMSSLLHGPTSRSCVEFDQAFLPFGPKKKACVYWYSTDRLAYSSAGVPVKKKLSIHRPYLGAFKVDAMIMFFFYCFFFLYLFRSILFF